MNPLAQLMRTRGHGSRAPTGRSTRASTRSWQPACVGWESTCSLTTAPRSRRHRPVRLLDGGRGRYPGDAGSARPRHRPGAPPRAAGRSGQHRAAGRGHRRYQRQEHGHGDAGLATARERFARHRHRRRRLWPARAPGCFTAGPANGPVVVEACESDGTLVGYEPSSASCTTSAAITPSSSRCARSSGPSPATAAGCWSTPAARRPRRSAAASTALSYGTAPDADAGSR